MKEPPRCPQLLLLRTRSNASSVYISTCFMQYGRARPRCIKNTKIARIAKTRTTWRARTPSADHVDRWTALRTSQALLSDGTNGSMVLDPPPTPRCGSSSSPHLSPSFSVSLRIRTGHGRARLQVPIGRQLHDAGHSRSPARRNITLCMPTVQFHWQLQRPHIGHCSVFFFSGSCFRYL